MKTTKSAPRTYRHGERAAQVRALHMRFPELNPSQLATRVGMSRQSAASAIATFMAGHTDKQLQSFQQNRAEVWDAIGMRSLGSVTEKKLRTASVGTLVTAAAIAEDKSRIIRGLATSIDVHVLLDIASMVRRDRREQPSQPIDIDAEKLTKL